MSTHWEDLRSRIGEVMPVSDDMPTVKELLDLGKDINRLLADEMHKAPCPHKSDTDYHMEDGRTFCGDCMRKKEGEAA